MNKIETGDDWIHLDSFAFPCILGLFDWEQRSSQTLAVKLSMGLNLNQAASGDLARSVDYSATLEQIQFIAQHGRWRMLESMASAIARLLLAPPAPGEERAQVRRAVVRLGKPDVFRGRAVPTVEIQRDLEWLSLESLPVQTSGARLEILQESKESGAYRVLLEKDGAWMSPAKMSCLVISGRARAGVNEIGRGDILTPGGHELHGLETTGASLLVVGEQSLSALLVQKQLR